MSGVLGGDALRVLLVSQYFWPEAFRVNDLALGLVERGHHVTVVTGQPNYETGSFPEGYGAFSPNRETFEGVDVRRFPLVSRGPNVGARLALNYLSFAASASLLAPLRLREAYDVALVYQMSPVTMALPAFAMKRLRGVPVVFWVQDLWPDTLQAMGKLQSERVLGYLRRAVGAMYNASERVLVVSTAFARAVEAAGVPRDRISYLPNWAERTYAPTDVEPDAPERREMPEGFCVGFAGNIGFAQSVDTVIAAADRLRDHDDIRWVFIGDGRRRQWAEQEVASRDLADRVTFLGRRPVDAMPRYLALLDAHLVTLRRDATYADSIPSKLSSLLACGRPVVAALDGEGARVVQESGSGVTCAPDDPGALAHAVLTMRGMTEADRLRMGRAGRSYFEANLERDLLLDRLTGWLRDAAKDGALSLGGAPSR